MANVLEPDIKPSFSIHIYNDKSLYFYHRSDFMIFQQINLALQIMLWTIEWMHHYEIWLVNSHIWIGIEISHDY